MCEHGYPVKRTNGPGGFTLIELLAVLTIIALLAAIVLGAGRRVSESGRMAEAHAELAAIASGLESYYSQYGDYPRTDDAGELLEALLGLRAPSGAAISGRAFIDRAWFRTANTTGADGTVRPQLLDPWEQGYVYVYRAPATVRAHSDYVLYSRGPDQAHELSLNADGFPNTTAPANADNLYASR